MYVRPAAGVGRRASLRENDIQVFSSSRVPGSNANAHLTTMKATERQRKANYYIPALMYPGMLIPCSWYDWYLAYQRKTLHSRTSIGCGRSSSTRCFCEDEFRGKFQEFDLTAQVSINTRYYIRTYHIYVPRSRFTLGTWRINSGIKYLVTTVRYQ